MALTVAELRVLPPSSDELRAILPIYVALGLKVHDIAFGLGVSETTVRRLLKQRGTGRVKRADGAACQGRSVAGVSGGGERVAHAHPTTEEAY